MPLVGIIANPAASKDIRRLVSQGRVVPDWEKVNTLRRVMLGLQAVGISRVVAMPDSSDLCRRASADGQLSLDFSLLEMAAYYEEDDTVRAAARMADMGVDCLVTLGGDGTNRVVAKGCAAIPLVAISTGTNNVFPTMVEGTLAGMAAGLVAQGRLDLSVVSTVSKTVRVYVDGRNRDLALVDVAISRERFVAARAIWDLATVYEVFLTRAEPSSLGLSSVGASLAPVSLADDGGLHYVLGVQPGGKGNTAPSHEGFMVLAPVAPGVVAQVPVARWRRLADGERFSLERRHCTVALDGERSFTVMPDQQLEVEVTRNGPPVVNVDAALRRAAELGLLRTK